MEKNQPPPPLPKKWLTIPNMSYGLIIRRFLAFKIPISRHYNSTLKEEAFDVSSVFDYAERNSLTLGLWIDLSHTCQYFDVQDVQKYNCKYVKLNVTKDLNNKRNKIEIRHFLRLCSDFFEKEPEKIIGVHCVHGCNRTGFAIVACMVELFKWNVDEAILEFSRLRPPGIYKPGHLKKLRSLYANGPVKYYSCSPKIVNNKEQVEKAVEKNWRDH